MLYKVQIYSTGFYMKNILFINDLFEMKFQHETYYAKKQIFNIKILVI